MDFILAKVFITCFICELVGFTSGVPLKDDPYSDLSTRNKRSPANGFSLFGRSQVSFSLPNPLAGAQQAFNNIGNFFKPPLSPLNKNNAETKDTQNTVTNKIPSKKMPDDTTSLRNGDIDRSIITLPPDMLVPNKTTTEGKVDNNNESTTKNPVNQNKGNATHVMDDDENKNNVNKIKIDKTLLDEIFNDLSDSTTTEDVTIDYTTETGDYESTTVGSDDLLRIPGPLVASLLG